MGHFLRHTGLLMVGIKARGKKRLERDDRILCKVNCSNVTVWNVQVDKNTRLHLEANLLVSYGTGKKYIIG